MKRRRDPFTDQDKYGIRAAWIYRKYDRETQRILGLSPSAIDVGIKKGELPTPLELTASGKASGFLGAQLIQVIEKRLARAARK